METIIDFVLNHSSGENLHITTQLIKNIFHKIKIEYFYIILAILWGL